MIVSIQILPWNWIITMTSFYLSGGMMFVDIEAKIKNRNNVSFRSKITNGTSCILHGNGPGVILMRSYVKQILNNGNLYIDDYVLRIGVDFFHWMLWWIIMPYQRLSHWLSVHHEFDIGFHSTEFSETVIWRISCWHIRCDHWYFCYNTLCLV
eukprot:TRINITY_DN5074_c0_g1_i1.p1 TRINITY_DN5074_c0_g1~~TRINITY_DN5074_c0_g1_i1.p1  ORF type:complete len:153 (+),score=10.79 TRINITY_DN5074_c0_g1_i1:23-481(+)